MEKVSNKLYRTASVCRKSSETDVRLNLNIDSGDDGTNVSTGCGFMDHMFTLFAFHSGFSLSLAASGDVDVDFHHLCEDIGICLGRAVSQALGDRCGIRRYANISLPMDEALVDIAMDISGRGFIVFNVQLERDKVGDMDTEVVEEFFQAFVRTSGITLHVNLAYGKNTHHIIEAVFKGFGRALGEASRRDLSLTGVPSSRGIVDSVN